MSIPADFSITDEQRAIVDQSRDELSVLTSQLVGVLSLMHGLPVDQAATVAVDVLIRLACLRAMSVAVVLHDRELSRDRWIETCGLVYDQSLPLFDDLLASLRKGGAA